MAYQNLTSSTGFSNIKRGSAVLPAGSLYVDVTFDVPLPTQDYSISWCLINSGLDKPLYVTNKTINGFRINALLTSLSDINIDWIVVW